METNATQSKPTTKKRGHHPDRISLKPECLIKLDHWTDTVKAELKGSRFTRNDMIHWLIQRTDNELSIHDLRQIREQYFDPRKALEWALVQLKQAQKSGQIIDTEKFVKDVLTPTAQKPDYKRVYKKKAAKTEDHKSDPLNQADNENSENQSGAPGE